MTNAVDNESKRDTRLSVALLLFLLCVVAGIAQTWILLLYFRSMVNKDWTYFLEKFPSYALPLDADAICLGDCFPDLPFVIGWIGIVSFFLGIVLVAYSWWKPKYR